MANTDHYGDTWEWDSTAGDWTDVTPVGAGPEPADLLAVALGNDLARQHDDELVGALVLVDQLGALMEPQPVGVHRQRSHRSLGIAVEGGHG